MKLVDSAVVTQQPKTTIKHTPIRYTDLSRGATACGLRANVRLDERVLTDYEELDPALGQNTAGAVLNLLRYQLEVEPVGNEGCLSLYLARRSNGQVVEVSLAIDRCRLGGCETYLLLLAGECEAVAVAA